MGLWAPVSAVFLPLLAFSGAKKPPEGWGLILANGAAMW